MSEQRIRQKLEDVARTDVPDDIDLWPRIRGRIGTSALSRANGHKGPTSRPPARRRLRVMAAGFIVCVAIGGALLIPESRLDVLEFLGFQHGDGHYATATASVTATEASLASTPVKATAHPTPTPTGLGAGEDNLTLAFEDTPLPE